MFDHLDKNGSWVLLVFFLVLAALLAATAFTVVRTRARKNQLEKFEDPSD